MPWQESGGGYTTKRGGFVRNPGQYEKLRSKGMSKEKAARIVNKEHTMKNPVELEKSDSLWRRDDVEKGILQGLGQGLRRTPGMGPMTRGTQAGFNAGSSVRNAGSAVRTAGSNFKAGLRSPTGPLDRNSARSMKAGAAIRRVPGAIQRNPGKSIAAGAGGAAVVGGGGYLAGQRKKRGY